MRRGSLSCGAVVRAHSRLLRPAGLGLGLELLRLVLRVRLRDISRAVTPLGRGMITSHRRGQRMVTVTVRTTGLGRRWRSRQAPELFRALIFRALGGSPGSRVVAGSQLSERRQLSRRGPHGRLRPGRLRPGRLRPGRMRCHLARWRGPGR